ncbi:SDR family oxidoreductase [bacterium]|nr:SDR family oxidoreductase [Candidatus Omnitrophota bacterium]MBU3929164.1 SDR family oxidoreductase [bacterium]MBU4122434.1 SDR family oxidoreductase [bacterium]
MSEFKDIKDKKVLITGASGGIGAGIARLFASYGACLGIHYCSAKKNAVRLAEEIKKKGIRIELFQGDLQKPESRNTLVGNFVKKYGRIDVLVNNAGAIYDYEHFSKLAEKSWDYTFDLNVKAPYYLSAAAFMNMKRNDGGRIINISSANVKYGGSARSVHYTASKAALENLTLGFAREGAKYNILVNSIRCGLIATQMHEKIKGYNEKLFKQRIELIPLKRSGKPIDIARMVLYLASECGSFITGETFTVAGGD